jgi:hypothetical protein
MSEFRLYTAKDLIDMPDEEDKYIVEGLLWERDHVMLIGKDKAGKSILSLQLACAIVSGTPFLSTYEVPIPMNVLYVQMEGKIQDTKERFKSMIAVGGIECNPSRLFILNCKSVALDSIEGLNTFKHVMNELPQIGVIILDPLYMAMSGDLIDNLHARNMCRNLRDITDTFNCALVLIHHQHRPPSDGRGGRVEETGSDSIFGSFVWRAFPDHVLSLYVRKDEVRLLTCDTQRSGKVIKNIELGLIHPYPLYFEVRGTDQKAYVHEINAYMYKNVDVSKGITAKELQEKTKYSESAVKKSLMVLDKEGKITKLNPGHRPVKYAPNIIRVH